MNIPALTGGLVGTGLAVGGSKIYKGVTGKEAGLPGSLAHVITNDKLDSKPAVILEQTKEGAKDLLTLGGITFGAAATGSLAAGTSNKVATALKNAKTKIAGVLDDIVVNSKGKSVKEIIKNTKIFGKFNSLPMPAKVGIVVGAAALAVAAPIISMVSAQKAGYIEGKHEV